ncbi:MAG: UDP-N-acetylmuramoyl-tripeptide--D-alanyl-D-alanine ligase [Dehalococcoidia bacterium]|nr:UDP-N-acetylmuramoyl-tripeptide--D-alanyl-D-alanine ligase [Dehalococcoidia bacterium]
MSPPVLDAAFVTAALGDRLQSRAGRAGRAAEATRFAGAAIDSRAVQPGDLFVALPGEHIDGHDFAAAAVRAGATGCLLRHAVEGAEEAVLFLVDDTLASLQALGAAWRAALTGTHVVGITGSVGKTTTKAIVASVLAARYRVQANPLNYNNEISVPLCLLELRPETERAVIEHGMYTTGEIALLCRWTHPRMGVVLNVGPTHLERARSMETIARAKRELIEALPADGVAVLNVDDPRVRAMAPHTAARVWWFGTSEEARVRGTDVASHGAHGFDFTLTAEGRSRRVHVPLPGHHLLSNVLAAAATAFADGLAFDEVAGAIEALDVPLRLNVIALPSGITVLDDAYNAQPASTLAALDLLEEMPGRHLALLGDMRELGEVSRAEHERVGRRAAAVVAVLMTIGDDARSIHTAAIAAGLADATHVTTLDEAVAALRARLAPGDVVLIKGSHALGLEAVVADLARDGGGDR